MGICCLIDEISGLPHSTQMSVQTCPSFILSPAAELAAISCYVRVIEKGSRNWKARRQKKLEQLAPSFAARGFKKAAVKLVRECLEGNAWHADHIRPVYKGGGLCHLENLRTLCVPCHQVILSPGFHFFNRHHQASAICLSVRERPFALPDIAC